MNPKIVLSDLKLYKEYKYEISEARRALEKNRQKKERLARAGTVCYGSDPKVRSTRGKDSYLIDLIDEERYYLDRLHKFERKVHEVDAIIAEISNEAREIIILKYVKGRSWKQLEDRFNYSKATLDSKIRKAIREIKEKRL